MRKKEIQEIITEMRQINERLLKLIAEERGDEGKEIIADYGDLGSFEAVVNAVDAIKRKLDG